MEDHLKIAMLLAHISENFLPQSFSINFSRSCLGGKGSDNSSLCFMALRNFGYYFFIFTRIATR